MYGAHTDSSLRGNYSDARADFTVEQQPGAYSDAEHALWRRLYARQSSMLQPYACRAFRDGLARMTAADGVPDLAAVNARLEVASGWTLVAVPGFIPDEQFFRHLAARRFPVTVWLRKPEEFDYLVEPDIFHDFFGHVPMLFDRRFGDYVQRYGEQALRLLPQGALPLLARLYWYTVEFGLIDDDEGLRVFGAGILSSGGETPYAIESEIPRRVRFELARCLRTEYRIDNFQKTYFVVRSLDALADVMTRDLSALVADVQAKPTLTAGHEYPGDTPVPPRGGRLAA
ncbi:phenylalanine 4-monooxygenase [Solimonas marina]|uniref:Phenylalanine-4-hydroxylase n=1 Tax=Solimonas marina TaxID=2714601 RepID=A0A970B898_9GAMM|nr:phenylalanine 4-monooxygenase [Solimonas marina]NKF22059.1 phenylalanine 4-monooxygenase [Solimonas marina]